MLKLTCSCNAMWWHYIIPLSLRLPDWLNGKEPSEKIAFVNGARAGQSILLNTYICGFWLHLFKTRNICVCIWNTFANFFWWIFFAFPYNDNYFMCIKTIFLWNHLYTNPKIHLWILLCAFINTEIDLTPYSNSALCIPIQTVKTMSR